MASLEPKAAKKGASVSPGNADDSARTFTDGSAALAFLASRVNVETTRPTSIDAGKVFTLERITAVLDALGNPHREFKSVHVAGSKGKGSVCEMTASCLEACGYTVGLYTSPHLVDPFERIRINQRKVGSAEFANLLMRVLAAEATLPKSLGQATHFELFTACAFLHFADQAVDIAVVETGLGGRHDATNVLQPTVSAITAIQLEHTEFLGSSLEEIARHKGGIIKPGAPAVSVPQPSSVATVLQECAAQAGTTIEFLNQEIDFSYRFQSTRELGAHARVVLTTPRSNFEHLPVPLKGEHQAINCGLALAILDALRLANIDTPELKVAAGLERTPSAGRLELIHDRPRIIIDGAHTPESVQAVVRSLGGQVKYDSMVAVFGCASDKDAAGMLAALSSGADKIIFTRADSPRAMDPRELHRKFNDGGKMIQVAATVKDALNLAARAVGRDDIILVIGSFAVAGEAKQLLLAAAERPRAQPPDAAIREPKPPKAARPTPPRESPA